MYSYIIFGKIEAHKIIDFIKETRFYKHLNVFTLMFVICFFYSSLIALILHS